MTPIRILLVDDHRSMLWGLAKLVESAPGLELVGTASCLPTALDAAAEKRPDVALLDLDLGAGAEAGPANVRALKQAGAAKVLILSGVRDAALQQQALVSGASGFVNKTEPAEAILKAIAGVHAGELWIDRASFGRVLASMSSAPRPRDPSDSLTPAERNVIAQIVRHKSAPNKVVADALKISTHTLRNHLASIYDKLSLRRRLDLVLYAIERKLDQNRT